MRCPRCKKPDTKVIDSRETDQGRAIRRRRECAKCGSRFTTFERIETANLIVVKKDGMREPYDRSKLERGIWVACSKRPISEEKINKMIGKLEERWTSRGKREVGSHLIGSDIMKGLKKIDEVAYIRFASVYKSFEDAKEFKQEIGKIKK